MKQKEFSEKDIVERYHLSDRKGKDAIISQVWYRYYLFVLKRLRRNYSETLAQTEIEDITAITFAEKFPAYLETLKEKQTPIDHLFGVLVAIGDNLCKDEVRRNNSKLRRPLAYLFSLTKEVEKKVSFDVQNRSMLPHYHKGELTMNRKDLYDLRTRLALGLLSELQQECILLCYVEEYSYQQVGDRLSVSYNSVRSALNHAKSNLQQFLSNSLVADKSPIPTIEIPKVKDELGLNLSVKTEHDLFRQAFLLLDPAEQKPFYLFYVKGINLLNIARQLNDKNTQKNVRSATEKLKQMINVNQELILRYNLS